MSIFGTRIQEPAHKMVKGPIPYAVPLYALLLTLAALASCSEKKPEHILTHAEMVEVMEEIYIAEEKVNRLAVPRDSSREIFEVMKEKVFESADITDSTFKRSFDYYMEHPDQMEMIYTALVDTLQLREQRAPLRLEAQ